jgi:hypothetical protein
MSESRVEDSDDHDTDDVGGETRTCAGARSGAPSE